MNDISSVLILPNLNRLGFACTSGVLDICGVAVTAATVAACVIHGVAMTATNVAGHTVFFSCTNDRIICGVTVTAAPVDVQGVYHS